MGKILKSWSGMRKYLEEDMLEESLKGRIRYNCTRYVGMDMDHIFEVYVDNKLVKQFSLETVNSYFLRMGISSDKDNNIKNTIGIREYWSDFWSTMSKYPMCDRDEYTDDEFCDALAIYRNSKIFLFIKDWGWRGRLKYIEMRINMKKKLVISCIVLLCLIMAGGIGANDKIRM